MDDRTSRTSPPPAPLRAYLASALTDLAASERERIYKTCRQLKALCAKHGVVLYLPFEHTDPVAHADIPAPAVYERDRKQVVTSDFLFVFCASASYGVGQENEIAAEHGVPVVYLIQRGCRVSRMLLGSDTQKLLIEYADVEDLLRQAEEYLGNTVPLLRKRRDALGEASPLGLGGRLRDLRERSEVSRKALADLIGVDEQRITRIEENPAEELSLNLKQLRSIAGYLHVDVTFLLVGATGVTTERMLRSKQNLKQLALDESMEYCDFELLWEGYLRQQRQEIGFVAATRDTHVVTKEQWRAWYRQILDRRNALNLEL